MKYLILFFMLLSISCIETETDKNVDISPPLTTENQLQDSVKFGCQSQVINADNIVGEKGGDLKYIIINFTYLGKRFTEAEKLAYTEAYRVELKELNDIFEPYNIQFRSYLDMVYFNDYVNYTTQQAYDIYFDNSNSNLRLTIEMIEEANMINVFAFRFDENEGFAGFTPTLTGAYQWYEEESPKWDRVFVSEYGMQNLGTLIHELFHYFHASADVQQMTAQEQNDLGIDSFDKLCRNRMNYGCATDQLTEKQVHNAVNNILTHRSYLLNYEE